MADCPKCGKHLRLIDWKQHCPHCGTNVVIYDIQERLMQDADKAEVQYYHFQKKIDRMKAAFSGSKLAIVRIFTSLIPILAILVPWVKGVFSEPFVPYDGYFTLFTLINEMDNFDTDALLGLMNTQDGKTAFIVLAAALVMIVLTVVLILVRFGCLTMACSKKGKAICYSFDIIMLVLVAAASVMLMVVPENPYFEIKFILAPLVYLLLLIVNFAVDIAIFKQGIEVKHAQCYVGGIPIEEYFKMVEDGVSQQELRAEMYVRLAKMQEEKEKQLAEEGK